MSDKDYKNKFNLTIKEASSYFNIGEKKLREVADAHKELILINGNKILFKRNATETYLNSITYL